MVKLPSWAFPARGRGETESALSSPAPATARDPGPLLWPPQPASLSQPVSPSPGRSSDSSSKMRPPTPLAPSALSPAAIDTVAVQGLLAPEMWGADSEPRIQSRFGLPLRPPPEPHHQPRRRQRRRRLPFHPPSSHGPAARRQPSHVTWSGHAPGRPRAVTRSLATPAPAGWRHWRRDAPPVCGLPDSGPAHSLTTGQRGSCPPPESVLPKPSQSWVNKSTYL